MDTVTNVSSFSLYSSKILSTRYLIVDNVVILYDKMYIM